MGNGCCRDCRWWQRDPWMDRASCHYVETEGGVETATLLRNGDIPGTVVYDVRLITAPDFGCTSYTLSAEEEYRQVMAEIDERLRQEKDKARKYQRSVMILIAIILLATPPLAQISGLLLYYVLQRMW